MKILSTPRAPNETACACWLGVTLYIFRRYTLAAWLALPPGSARAQSERHRPVEDPHPAPVPCTLCPAPSVSSPRAPNESNSA